MTTAISPTRPGSRTFLSAVKDLALDRDHARVRQRAAVAAGTTSDATWAAPLASLEGAREFFGLVARGAVLLRAGFPRLPFSVSVAVQTARPTGYRVGQGEPKPITSVPFVSVKFEPAIVGTIAVLSKELVESSAPGSDAAISRQLSSAIVSAANTALLDPNVAGSITNGITPTASSGIGEVALFEDLVALLSIGDAPVLITSLPWALRIGAALGNAERLVTILVAPEAGDLVVAVDSTAVVGAWSDGIDIDIAESATLQMLDDPLTGATSLVSMYQTDSIAVRVHLLADWRRVRDDGVAVLDMSGGS